MREIKFRGKKLYGNGWIEGYVFKTDVGFFIGPYNEEQQVIPETVGEYIGLKDRDGNDICEDDILEDGYGGMWVIKYVDCSFWFVNPSDKSNRNTYDWLTDNNYWEDGYIIRGNIHENPELLQSL